MGEIRENLKRNIGYYLTLKGISQKDLAKKLGVSQSSVTNWIKGKNSPDIDLIEYICQILDIEITDLMGTRKAPPSEDGDAFSESAIIARAYETADDGIKCAVRKLLDVSVSAHIPDMIPTQKEAEKMVERVSKNLTTPTRK